MRALLARCLVRFLALFLLPIVLIVTTTTPAEALTANGSAVAGHWKFDGLIPGEWADCTFTAFYKVTRTTTLDAQEFIKSTGGDCETGTGVTLEHATFWASGTKANGSPCAAGSAASPITGTVGADDTFSFLLEVTLQNEGDGSTLQDDLCSITKICTHMWQSNWGRDWSATGCTGEGESETITMGTPPWPTGSANQCVVAGTTYKATGASGAGYLTAPRGSPYSYKIDWSVTFTPSTWKANKNPSVIIYYKYKDGTEARRAITISGTIPPNGTYSGTETITTDSSTANWDLWNGVSGTITGVQAWMIRGDVGTPSPDWYNSTENVSSTSALGGSGWTFPQDGGTSPYLATTDGAHCRWYYGTQLATGGVRPQFNTPEAGLTGGPDPTVEPNPINGPPATKADCNFDILSPSSWLEGGMCAAVGLLGQIVGVLGQILGALSGLPAALAGAIADAIAAGFDLLTDILSSLFVPSENFFSNKADLIKGDLEDTSPGQWVEGFSDAQDAVSGGSVSGCAGLPLDVDLGHGVSVHEHLGAACTGSMASAANLVRIALSVALVIGGGIACIRALGSGFNWNPGSGGSAT